MIGNQHTLIHHYNLDLLYQEFNKLKTNYYKLLRKIGENKEYVRETDEYCKILNYTIDLIKDKIDHINVNTRKPVGIRNRRGLINGLGSIIKFITGNLDASDCERYENIFEHIKNNEIKLQNQIDSQFSISSELMREFNSTIQDINFNNDQIKKKIAEFNDITQSNALRTNISSIKEVINHQQLLFSILLGILQDIENSVTFCKLGRIHPSIIGSHELLEELEKISTLYKNGLPWDLKQEHILEIESNIKLTCAIHEKEIVYFLEVPLTDRNDYNLYYLRPIPSATETNDYVSVFPSVNYVLKSIKDNIVIPLTANCESGTVFICKKNILSNQNVKCEQELITSGLTTNCEYVKLNLYQNWIENVPESGQLLAIFPSGDKIEIHSKQETEIRELKGIFLISKGDSEVFYKNQPLYSESDSNGQPKLLTNVDFKIKENQIANVTLTLKQLDMRKVQFNEFQHTKTLDLNHVTIPSLWTIILYVIIIICTSYVLAVYCKERKKLTITQPQS